MQATKGSIECNASLIAPLLSIARSRGAAASVRAAPVPMPEADNGIEGTVVGDDRTAMEAASMGASPRPASPAAASEPPKQGFRSRPMRPTATSSSTAIPSGASPKCSCAILGIGPKSGRSTRRFKNPHRIYPGDTLRLVYIDGRPRFCCSGARARQAARVSRACAASRSRRRSPRFPTTPSPPSCPSHRCSPKGYIAAPPTCSARSTSTSVMAEGNTLYARGFWQPVVSVALQPRARRRRIARPGRQSSARIQRRLHRHRSTSPGSAIRRL